MSCLDIRRILAASPESQRDDVLQHLTQCRACAAYAEQERNFNLRLGKVMRVAPPEGLASRILLQHQIGEKQKYLMRRSHWRALTASVVLTIGLVSGMLLVNYPYSLEDIALTHIKHDAQEFNAHKLIQLAQINQVLAPYNLSLDSNIGRVSYAKPCHIHKSSGAHLVMEGEHGSVAILFMPGEYVMQRTEMHDDHHHGLLIPVENGSIAIIGEENEALERIATRIGKALTYTA